MTRPPTIIEALDALAPKPATPRPIDRLNEALKPHGARYDESDGCLYVRDSLPNHAPWILRDGMLRDLAPLAPILFGTNDRVAWKATEEDKRKVGVCLLWNGNRWCDLVWRDAHVGCWVREQPPPPPGGGA